jgi:hypothetical protein
MSDDPPDDLCAPTTIGTNVTVDDSWNTFVWHSLTVGVGVGVILLAAAFVCRNRGSTGKFARCKATTPESSVSSKEELTELNGCARCYNSTGLHES